MNVISQLGFAHGLTAVGSVPSSLRTLTVSASAVAGVTDDVSAAISEGKSSMNFRYRFEGVDQDGVNEDAAASTLRSRYTFVSGSTSGFSMGLETDYVSVIGPEDYNSTVNGRSAYPVVADPDGFDLNQAYIKYNTGALAATFGRQRIALGDQRFVGGVAWRQNEQTYDAARFVYSPSQTLSLDYALIMNVNRIFGPDDGAQPADWESESHLLTATKTLAGEHKVSAFAYLLDFQNGNGLPNSNATYGLSYVGSLAGIKVSAKVATQSDYADNPIDYDASMYSISLSKSFAGITGSAGFESLGSDNGVMGFRTPLATLHKFQGTADKFLVTPAGGVEDVFVGVAGRVGKLKLAATWHDLSAAETSEDYGSELDLVATLPVSKKTSVQLKYADFQSDGFATDTSKVWLTVNVKL